MNALPYWLKELAACAHALWNRVWKDWSPMNTPFTAEEDEERGLEEPSKHGGAIRPGREQAEVIVCPKLSCDPTL